MRETFSKIVASLIFYFLFVLFMFIACGFFGVIAAIFLMIANFIMFSDITGMIVKLCDKVFGVV